MTAAYRVVVAERKEIAMVTIICDCGARLAYPVETAIIPSACGSCNKLYGHNERNALAALGKFHREAAAAEASLGREVFQFEIKQVD
jgi:hypothetical protein